MTRKSITTRTRKPGEGAGTTDDGSTIDEPPVVRPFADFLVEQSRGRTHDELSDSLQTLIARVMDTGKAGTLTLGIRIEPVKGSYDERMVMVTDKIALKLPEYDRKGSTFWADGNNNLTGSDPNQLAFEPLRELPGGRVDTRVLREAVGLPPRGVNGATGEVGDDYDDDDVPDDPSDD